MDFNHLSNRRQGSETDSNGTCPEPLFMRRSPYSTVLIDSSEYLFLSVHLYIYNNIMNKYYYPLKHCSERLAILILNLSLKVRKWTVCRNCSIVRLATFTLTTLVIVYNPRDDYSTICLICIHLSKIHEPLWAKILEYLLIEVWNR